MAVGIFLAQPDDGSIDHPNTYASQKLNKVERNYSMAKGEALAMIFTLHKFWQYLP